MLDAIRSYFSSSVRISDEGDPDMLLGTIDVAGVLA